MEVVRGVAGSAAMLQQLVWKLINVIKTIKNLSFYLYDSTYGGYGL